MDEVKIKNEAKEIMNNFMNALSNIEVEEEFILKRDNCFREENSEQKLLDEKFRNDFLSNAPKTSAGAILANKGEWTKK